LHRIRYERTKVKSNGSKHTNNPVVLVVDDTEDNLDLLEFALKRKPVTLLRATSGTDCFSIAKEKLPDIIILDIQMPEMDGFETLQKLRNNPLTAHIPVILLTAQHKDPESIEKGFKLGADEYLTKPIEIEELLVRVRMLLRVKHMKDELDKTKSDFMAMLIHDLRSPLLSIKGVVDLLKETETGTVLNDDHIRMFEAADLSLDQMLTLINNFLDLSKYKTNNVVIYQEPVDLKLLVENAMKKVEYQYNQKQIAIEKLLNAELPDAYVDAQKTQQVFLNLLDNALKFTHKGGKVTIGAEIDHGDTNGNNSNGKYIRISIRDTGIGMHPEELEKLFQPYRQTESAQSISEKGCGLGLSICKLIVEAHGGSINVISEPGKHTTFYFTLPVAQQN